MSNSVFPSLPGLKWSQEKIPIFSTQIQRAVSGKEARASQYVYPLYQFTLSYEVLREVRGKTELQQLLGLYLQMRGPADTFLYTDGSDNNANNASIGTGNGAGLTFQLVRSYGANGYTFVEPCTEIVANSITVYANNNAIDANNYTVGLTTGIVTFGNNAAPANGAVLTATFQYRYRVRFLDDEFNVSQFMRNLWEAKKVEFIGRLGNFS